jgi:hypothetical protein
MIDIVAGLSSDQESNMEGEARTIVDAWLTCRTFAVCDRWHSLCVLVRSRMKKICAPDWWSERLDGVGVSATQTRLGLHPKLAKKGA